MEKTPFLEISDKELTLALVMKKRLQNAAYLDAIETRIWSNLSIPKMILGERDQEQFSPAMTETMHAIRILVAADHLDPCRIVEVYDLACANMVKRLEEADLMDKLFERPKVDNVISTVRELIVNATNPSDIAPMRATIQEFMAKP